MAESAGLEMALWASKRGAMVIPAYINKDLQKMPLIKQWQSSGSQDEEVIRGWYRERPWACVGVLGGKLSWAVWDCDGSEAVGGFRSICNSVSGIDWESALIYRTPGRKDADGEGGGLHCMWKYPSWMADLGKAEIKREGWRGGIEFRGKGTWTLLPCSRKDGEYEIINAPDVLGEMPRELWLAFAAEAAQTPVVGGGGDLREISPEDAWNGAPWYDNRKSALAGLCWWLAIRGTDEDEYWETLYRFSKECCSPELDESIIRRKGEYTWQRANAARERVAAEAAAYSKWMKI